jgi:hypothetical protein
MYHHSDSGERQPGEAPNERARIEAQVLALNRASRSLDVVLSDFKTITERRAA